MIYKICYRARISAIEAEEKGGSSISRTVLDSHANFCVVGKHCFILSQSCKTVDILAFSEDAGGLNGFPIVDDILAYNFLCTHQEQYLHGYDDKLHFWPSSSIGYEVMQN